MTQLSLMRKSELELLMNLKKFEQNLKRTESHQRRFWKIFIQKWKKIFYRFHLYLPMSSNMLKKEGFNRNLIGSNMKPKFKEDVKPYLKKEQMKPKKNCMKMQRKNNNCCNKRKN